MIRFILNRLFMLVPTFIGVTLAAFAFVRLIPGDPVELLVGERGIDPARHAQSISASTGRSGSSTWGFSAKF
jgi:dipeptide transport system permease protein